jgi:hypothetical protein
MSKFDGEYKNMGKFFIISLSKADLQSADIYEILQREISCTEFLPKCQKYEKCWVEKYEVH